MTLRGQTMIDVKIALLHTTPNVCHKAITAIQESCRNKFRLKNPFKYGFVEARVKLAKSPAVRTIWMHDDNIHPSYSRWINENKDFPFLETPSLIRSRRWQEIDLLEAMNSEINDYWKKYIPNIQRIQTKRWNNHGAYYFRQRSY